MRTEPNPDLLLLTELASKILQLVAGLKNRGKWAEAWHSGVEWGGMGFQGSLGVFWSMFFPVSYMNITSLGQFKCEIRLLQFAIILLL